METNEGTTVLPEERPAANPGKELTEKEDEKEGVLDGMLPNAVTFDAEG